MGKMVVSTDFIVLTSIPKRCNMYSIVVDYFRE